MKGQLLPLRKLHLAGAFAALLIGGCGAQDYAPTEKDYAKEIVSNISDFQGHPEKFKTLFLEESVPDQATLEKLEPYMVKVSDIIVHGDTGTASIMFERSMTGEMVGPEQWTLQKVDGKWKIATAPIPES